ncbi:hypothetical protein ACFQ1S_10825, partial [Kibdelosporangium lantanae]
ARDVVVKQVQAGAPDAVRRLVDEIGANIDHLLDIKELAVATLRRNPELMVRLVKDISRPEMAFIARSGIYFGFGLGLVQTLVWAFTEQPVVLPLFGMCIGWFTDWLAIKLVFFPRERKRILGVVPFQGIFQRRRDEVAQRYGEIVASEVMTGYLNRPEENAFQDVDGVRFYRTGDRGHRRDDGVLLFHGRHDDEVKVRGYRVNLNEVRRARRPARRTCPRWQSLPYRPWRAHRPRDQMDL